MTRNEFIRLAQTTQHYDELLRAARTIPVLKLGRIDDETVARCRVGTRTFGYEAETLTDEIPWTWEIAPIDP